jgi:hypothetical protein
MPPGIARLEARIKALEAQAQAPKAQEEEGVHLFGLVGCPEVILLRELPTDGAPKIRGARATADKWLKLCYPRTRVETISAATGERFVEHYFRAQVVDPRTGEIRYFYVSDRAADGAPAFQRFCEFP